jgi:tetratricopeptide (TPR) repeat protein
MKKAHWISTKASNSAHFFLFFIFWMFFQQPVFAQSKAFMQSEFARIKTMLPEDLIHAEKEIIAFHEKGIKLSNDEFVAKAHYLFALFHYYHSRYYISNKYYATALKSAYAKEDLNFKETCLNNMGVNYEMQNMLGESLNAYHKSLKIAEKLRDSSSIEQSFVNIGLLNAKSKNYQQAHFLTFRALQFFLRHKDSIDIALCYQNLSSIASNERNYLKSIYYAQKTLEISKLLHDDFQVAACYYNIANCYYYLEDIQKSDSYLHKALQFSKGIGYREEILIKIFIQLGQNETQKNNFNYAEKCLLYALKLIRYTEVVDNKDLTYHALSNLYAKSNNYEAYERIQDEHEVINEENEVSESKERVNELQAVFEYENVTEKLKDQTDAFTAQKKQFKILGILFGIILVALVLFIWMYYKMRRYTRSLFEHKVEQTQQEQLLSETIDQTENENKVLMEIYNQILYIFKNKKPAEEITMQELSNQIGVYESEIQQAIHLFGNKDYPSFLNRFYIDSICKEMLAHGRKTPLTELIAKSPFKNQKMFHKEFVHFTGLTPEQFMVHCEDKIQHEKSR